MEELDKAELDRELSYEFTDDCFTVRYGSIVSHACKLCERPACEKVFGRSHAFGRAAAAEAEENKAGRGALHLGGEQHIRGADV